MSYFTANDARRIDQSSLDDRIAQAVRERRSGNGAYVRVYHDDIFAGRIVAELEGRGFTNIRAPNVILEADVYFEWSNAHDPA